MRRIAGYLASILTLSSLCCFGQTELITNGGFEQGIPPWLPSPFETGVDVQNNAGRAHSGAQYLKMGLVGSRNDVAYQIVTIPTNTVSATLSYWHNLYCPVANDGTFTAALLYTNGIVATNIEIVGMSNLGGGFDSNFYTLNAVDVTPFAGQTVAVWFQLVTGTFGASAYAAIDDVSLQVETTADIPPNDFFTNRTTITGNSASIIAKNTFATIEPGEPRHAGDDGGHSLWWQWTAPGDGVLQIDTSGSDFRTALAVYTGSSISNLVPVASNDANDNIDSVSRVKFAVRANTSFDIALDGIAIFDFGTAHLNFLFTPDVTPPKVTISSPASNAKLTNGTVTVTGTASDNVVVARVEYRLENASGTNDYQPADGTNKWTATVTGLVPGMNTIRVRAFDSVSNMSPAVARSVDFVVVSPLTVTINGSGTISPPSYTNILLEVGKSYTVTAKPAVANLFSNWTGDVFSSNPKLTFTMQSNMMINANFITNVFIAPEGSYAGLFSGTNNTGLTNAGYFSATVTSKGALSAKVMLPVGTVSISSKLNLDGSFSNTVARSAAGPVQIIGQLDLNGGDVITGQLTIASDTLDLTANRMVFSKTAPAPQAGKKYTVVIPGSADSSTGPGGYGTGTATIDASGNISFTGILGDGTKVTQKTFIGKNGQWPFFAAPYSKQGLIIGWLMFDMADASNGPSGNLTWMKAPVANAKFYAAGFDFEGSLETASSLYVLPTGAPIFSWANGIAVLQGARLSQSITNTFTIGANNKVTGDNGMKLTFTPASGTFKGSVLNPDTGKPLTISGAALQNEDTGFGEFPGTSQTGSVLLLPAP
jgi:hypothetical protein